MTVFNEYARYYDLLYQDKDYAGEAEYVNRLIQAHAPGAKSILNLGCGSGRHDQCLAELGYSVTGVDISEEMLTAAKTAAKDKHRLEYQLGDVRTARLGEKFDVVISLFHVMSYQITNADLAAAFATAAVHLKPEGLFVFDCWYGPGVLSDLPAKRVKELEDGSIKVHRVAEPLLHPNENVVDVNYTVNITDKTSGEVRQIKELHRMRYLFQPETELMLTTADFKPLVMEEWLTGRPLGFSSWNAVFVAKVAADLTP